MATDKHKTHLLHPNQTIPMYVSFCGQNMWALRMQKWEYHVIANACLLLTLF